MRRTAPRAYAHLGGASLPHLALLGDGGSALQPNTTMSVRDPLRESPRFSSGRVLREEPLLSIVVPTKNERGNVVRLIERLEAVLPTVAMEIIFVDASSDGTAEAVEEAAGRSKREIVLLRQGSNRRVGGLGGAVVQGIRAARAPWVCVMDADLQHPPELITALLEQAEARELDLVVASRYCERGERSGFGWARAMASRSSTTVARLLFPQRLRDVTDPMSGFFLVRRDALALDDLRPRGFKILLEILVRHPGLRVAEVWFSVRPSGTPDRARRRFARGCDTCRCSRGCGSPGLGSSGASGLVVNTLVLALLTDVGGVFYVVSAVIATQASTLWNFCFTELWVFSDREHKRGRATRMGLFFLMNNTALALRGPLLVLLTSGLGIHYVVSNIVSLIGLTLVRFALADTWIWAKARPTESPPASVRLRHPRHRQRPVGRAPARAGALPGRIARRGAGHPGAPGARRLERRRARRSATARAGSASEWRSHGSRRIEATASPLVGRSPHVLYTNVVEPILRWTFAERGYALVHAACLAKGDNAFLVTARTDTGKTTTSLRLLDCEAYSFLSDDLTLVSPAGRVLTYPKPLTISRHTLKAVKTPLLTRRERAGLLIQSRLHSRSGRRFALILARTHLPAATINAVVQLLVPPPKYHVERLVPGVEVAPEAHLAGMVVIERGGVGGLVLDEREALETLMSNCEDAYGFPPYSEIEDSLRRHNGSDLRDVERAIVASALSGVPAAVLRSESMDWWRRLPGVVHDWTGPAATNGARGSHA